MERTNSESPATDLRPADERKMNLRALLLSVGGAVAVLAVVFLTMALLSLG